MRNHYLKLILLFVCSAFTVAAQDLPKATLPGAEPDPEQRQVINDGIRLHDQRKYSEAIAKYEQVLKQCPDCTLAIYELAFTYSANGNTAKALETAFNGAKYKSSSLPNIYVLIANIWDAQGQPKEAVELYLKAIDLFKKTNSSTGEISNALLNLGVSYAKQKQFDKARASLKTAVEFNQLSPSASYYLAEVFYGAKYKVPAMLATARFLTLEQFSPRSKRAAMIFTEVITGGAKKDESSNTINIFLNTDEPKDEGDFGGLSLITGLLSAGTDVSEENKGKSDEEKFVDKVDGFIGFLETDMKKNKSTFVGKNYIPFLLELKKKGYVEPLAYLVMAHNGNAIASKWVLTDNAQKVVAMTSWAKTFEIPN